MQYLNDINSIHLHRTTLGIARYLASRADYGTGKNIYPGEETIAYECGLKTTRGVREHMKILRDLKLITRVRHNSGRYGHFDEYWLSWPLDTSILTYKVGVHVRDESEGPFEPVRLKRKRDNEKPRGTLKAPE